MPARRRGARRTDLQRIITISIMWRVSEEGCNRRVDEMTRSGRVEMPATAEGGRGETARDACHGRERQRRDDTAGNGRGGKDDKRQTATPSAETSLK